MLNRVADMVRDAGFSCQVGYHSGGLPQPSRQMAVVHRKQIRDGLELLSVTMVEPVSQGEMCEENAFSLYTHLTAQGGKCNLDGCRFDPKMDCYTQEITVCFPEAKTAIPLKVSVNSDEVPGATAFSWGRQITEDRDAPGTYLPGDWTFEITQKGASPVGIDVGTFSLKVEQGADILFFTGCRWTDMRVEHTGDGAVMVRKGCAASFTG